MSSNNNGGKFGRDDLKSFAGSLTTLFVLVAMLIFFSIRAPGFSTTRNLYYLLQQVTVFGVLAVGQTFVIISRGIDLSQSAIVGLVSIVGAMLMTGAGLPVWLSLLIALSLGVLVGLVNGVIIPYLRLPAFIATLGSMQIVKAAALIFCSGNNIYNLPPQIQAFGHSGIGRVIPSIALIMIVIVVVAHIFLRHTRFGRYTYAVGSNEQAAKFSGIDVKRHLVWVYVISGFLSAIAGVIMLCRLNSGVALAGQGYEMNSIAAVVIGGGSLFGGEGGILGAIVGTLIMAVLSNGLQLMGVSTYWQDLFVGLVLLLAVFIDNVRRSKQG